LVIVALVTLWSYWKRVQNENGTINHLRCKTAKFSWWIVTNLVLSSSIWLLSLAVSIISILPCEKIGSFPFGILTYHVNLSVDIITVIETLFVAVSRVNVGNVGKLECLFIVVGIISGVLGLANSSLITAGESQGYAHFSVGFVIWGVGSLCREWSFWF